MMFHGKINFSMEENSAKNIRECHNQRQQPSFFQEQTNKQ